ncbi:hypothetical protein E5Q_05385 [Mixia osmundae IAM 14324]|uniref:Fe2OG dioxygenase domain-containing protein n=2 Tax=Mixia osmundae (strain CBS 9802 / IAM 14324 / JCM 22182 / KY 12970) TaxID=764103 RepID=G7E787_MIXOS|nr:hypothetical protein E5Q_05385 [Mixia osmundae IAM 14324]
MGSLFGSDDDEESSASDDDPMISHDSTCPVEQTRRLSQANAISGLHHIKLALDSTESSILFDSLYEAFFANATSNQVMLFASPSSRFELPTCLQSIFKRLPSLLLRAGMDLSDIEHYLPPASSLPRHQIIVNLYRPGEGITPHVDLPHRYADGIIGLSLGGACVMDFAHRSQTHCVLLEAGDLYLLRGDARYNWLHGIAYREQDTYLDANGLCITVSRALRISVTFRTMLEGSDLVYTSAAS